MKDAAPPPGLRPGDHFDRYRIEGFLGRGGMGEVYRAFDTRLRRAVALKVLRREKSSGPDELQRVLTEAQAMAGIAHRNIVTVYDVAAYDGTAYFTMELLDGGPLQRWAGPSNGRLADKLRWLREIANALVAVHASGLLHRDVKPGNILVSADGTIKLLDFGIAKRVGAADTRVSPQTVPFTPETATGLVVGTPRYMAPEQHLGQRASAECDQYAWALVATELFTAACPQPLDDVTAPLARVGVPESVVAIIARAKHIDPRGRFPSMAELVRALDLVAADPSAGRGSPTAQAAPFRSSGAPAMGLTPPGPGHMPVGSAPVWSDYPTTGGPTASPLVMRVAPMAQPSNAQKSSGAGVVALALGAGGVLLLALGGVVLFILGKTDRQVGTDEAKPDASIAAAAKVISPPPAASPVATLAPAESGGRPKAPSAPKSVDAGAPKSVDAGAPKPVPKPSPGPIPPRNVRVVVARVTEGLRREQVEAEIAKLKPQIDACYQLPNCSIDTTYMCIDPTANGHYTPAVHVNEDGTVFQVLNGGNSIPLTQCIVPILKSMHFAPFKTPPDDGWMRVRISLDIVLL